jgi:hypothetical protein
MKSRKHAIVVPIALLIICASGETAIDYKNLSIVINNPYGNRLHAIPFIVNVKEQINVNTISLDDEQNSTDVSDNIETWIVDRGKISENFRVVVANGHLGIKQNYVYYEDFQLSKSGKELKINLKSYELDIDVLVDRSFRVPKKSSDSSIEVIVQLFKIDDVGEVVITTSVDKVGNNKYRKKILVFQPGEYWVQVRYMGGEIKGDDNKFIGYPVWGEIININNHFTNLKIVGDKRVE